MAAQDLAQHRADQRLRDERMTKARAELTQRFTKDRADMVTFLSGNQGEQLIEILESWYGGDTFDLDPYKHAYNAGQRAVLQDLKSLIRNKEK